MNITLRPAEPGDGEFLYRLYASTRLEELNAWGWDAAQGEAFLQLQYTAQKGAYDASFPDAVHRIILDHGRPVGRILVDEADDEFCLVDIALLPEHRNSGIGSSLIRDLLGRAEAAGKAVGLSVTKGNPAAALYQRLGFSVIADDGVYLRMRSPGPPVE